MTMCKGYVSSSTTRKMFMHTATMADHEGAYDGKSVAPGNHCCLRHRRKSRVGGHWDTLQRPCHPTSAGCFPPQMPPCHDRIRRPNLGFWPDRRRHKEWLCQSKGDMGSPRDDILISSSKSVRRAGTFSNPFLRPPPACRTRSTSRPR